MHEKYEIAEVRNKSILRTLLFSASCMNSFNASNIELNILYRKMNRSFMRFLFYF